MTFPARGYIASRLLLLLSFPGHFLSLTIPSHDIWTSRLQNLTARLLALGSSTCLALAGATDHRHGLPPLSPMAGASAQPRQQEGSQCACLESH